MIKRVATRGRHAGRFSPQERDELFARAAREDVHTWIAYSLEQVQSLEAALFAYLVLALNHAPEEAGTAAATLFDATPPLDLSALVADLPRRRSGPGIDQAFRVLVAERNWLVHRSGVESRIAPPISDQTAAVLERLERISSAATHLREDVQALVEQHLARKGLSQQEIERTTDETARRWLAA